MRGQQRFIFGGCVSKKRLLCVDDETLGLTVRKLVLERHGYDVLTAAEPAEGLTIFHSNTIDAVVLDYYMPGMDGGQVAAEMKKAKPNVPIILLSAYVSLPDSALSSVDAFITKGGSPEVLLGKLQELVRREAA